MREWSYTSIILDFGPPEDLAPERETQVPIGASQSRPGRKFHRITQHDTVGRGLFYDATSDWGLHAVLQLEKWKERDHKEDVNTGWRIILKWTLEE
jgi:hypothetical protein